MARLGRCIVCGKPIYTEQWKGCKCGGSVMNPETAVRLAIEIWGFAPNSMQLRPDGGVDIDYGYADAHPYGHHRLDKHGRVACHTTCQDAQKSFIQSKWLKGEV